MCGSGVRCLVGISLISVYEIVSEVLGQVSGADSGVQGVSHGYLHPTNHPVFPIEVQQHVVEPDEFDHVYDRVVDAPDEKTRFCPGIGEDLDVSIARGRVCARHGLLRRVYIADEAHEVESVDEGGVHG